MALSSLLAGGLGFMGAQQAAGAAEQAAAEARAAGQTARADLSPWMTSGQGAVGQIAALLGLGKFNYVAETPGGVQHARLDGSDWQNDQKNAFAKFQTDPGYQWRMDEGIRARDRSAAAKGMLLSGAQEKAIENWGQGLASEEFGNYFNRLQGLSGSGASAANAGASAGLDAAKAAGQFVTQAGQARQSGYNALASGVIRADNNAQKWASRIWGGGMGG